MFGARWTNGILAIWLILSAFLGFTTVSNVVNMLTVGTVVAGVGLALLQVSRWQGWTATAAGLWLIAAVLVPFLRSGTGLLLNSLIVGAAVLVASVPVVGRREGGRRPAPQPVPWEEEPAPSPDRPWEEAESEERKLVHH